MAVEKPLLVLTSRTGSDKALDSDVRGTNPDNWKFVGAIDSAKNEGSTSKSRSPVKTEMAIDCGAAIETLADLKCLPF